MPKKIFPSYMGNSIPLKMKLVAKFVPYDVLLCYNREIYTARSDDSNMAISTISSYEKLDYNKPCVRGLYSFGSTSTTVLCSGQILQSVFRVRKNDKVDIFDYLCWEFARVVEYCVHSVFWISLIGVYRSKIT